MNISAIQAMATAGDEHKGGHRALLPMALTSAQVLGEHVAGRRVHGHQTGLAEFRAADGQHRRIEVDIVQLEVTGFAKALGAPLRK